MDHLRHDRIRGPPPLTGASTTGVVLFVPVSVTRHGWAVHGARIRLERERHRTDGRRACAGLTTFGSDLKLSEIKLEPSMTDGRVFDPPTMAVPSILCDTVVRAVDGLQYAYRAGITTAVVSPIGSGFLQGIGTTFSTGAPNTLAYGAILQSETALHISIHSEMRASVNTQIAALRNMLFSSSTPGPGSRVKVGEIPLVIKVHTADIMATLKPEFEASTSAALGTTFARATEAYLLAAGVSAILAPACPYPEFWDFRRVLPGPPVSRNDCAASRSACNPSTPRA
ncbi:hypothetical protein FB451DRAFT_1533398 [Mycena latifolia]|nr:hypothetical protein FB451DRAFT_1533398 [Mycena latifolia]